MKKTLMFLVVLSALAAGGFYGSTWFGTHQLLQRLKAEMAEVGVLKWEGIAPSLMGKVRVDELRLTLFELNQPVRIGSMLFDAASPQALLGFLFDDQAAWPASAALAINGVQLILRPELTKTWTVKADADVPQWPRPWHLRACGEHNIVEAADLMAMGIDTLDMDISLRWENTSTDAALLRGEVNAGVMGSADFMMRSEQLPHRVSDLSKGLPGQWEALNLVVRDAGFMRRLAAFCARDRFDSTGAWAQAATDELTRELAPWGIQASARLTALYRQWLREGGSISLELPSNHEAVPAKPEAVATYLGRDDLVLRYNGQRISDIDLTLAVEDFSARAAPPAPEPVAAPAADPAQWRMTPLASASRWLERRVRIRLASGRRLEGRLSAINERQLQVARYVEGGEFASTAALGEITVFEVWRRRAEVPEP